MKSIGKQNPADLLSEINELTMDFVKIIEAHSPRLRQGQVQRTGKLDDSDIGHGNNENHHGTDDDRDRKNKHKVFEMKLFSKKKFQILFSSSSEGDTSTR
jgi:hypothetical protein